MKEIMIGRDEANDICIESLTISRFHATLIIDNNSFIYTDKSSNGSYIDGRRLPQQPVRISFGQSIILSDNVPLPWDAVKQIMANECFSSSKSLTVINNGLSIPVRNIEPQRNEGIKYHVNNLWPKIPDYMPLARVPNLSKWNWGAFFIYHFWGFANGAWWLFIIGVFFGWTFVPNIIMGIYGTRMAWENKKWDSVEEFEHTQHSWACWGFGLFLFSIIVMLVFYAVLISVL